MDDERFILNMAKQAIRQKINKAEWKIAKDRKKLAILNNKSRDYKDTEINLRYVTAQKEQWQEKLRIVNRMLEGVN